MPRRLLALAVLAATVAARPGGAAAEDAAGKASKAAELPKADRRGGREIRWARSWAEAQEEAAERNALVFLHSHGST